MKIIRIFKFDISEDTHQQIIKLKNFCFPTENARLRSHSKQLPYFRYLYFVEDTLVAHIGVDHRIIRVGDFIFTIFGVIDLCVKLSHRQHAIASKLLSLLTELAKEKSVDFLFLVSHNEPIY